MKDQLAQWFKEIGSLLGLKGYELPLLFMTLTMYFFILPDIKNWKETNIGEKLIAIIFTSCYIIFILLILKFIVFGK